MPTTPVLLVIACDGSPAALHAADFVATYRGGAARLRPRAVNVQPRPLTLWPGAGNDSAALNAALHDAGLREPFRGGALPARELGFMRRARRA
jgi:hypothetical protein